MNHFDEMTVLLYLEGQLDGERSREVKEHAASCPSCRALLSALESEGIWLRESLVAEDESVPARLVAAPERGAAPWGWLTALGLGAGGAYTLWTGFVEPWQTQAEQAGFTQGNLLTMLFFSGSFWKGWDAMRSAMEIMAMATLGLVVMWLVRRRFRRATTFAVVMAAALCAVALPPRAAAADTEHGKPNYTLAAGQVVKTDLIVAADRTVIDGDVDGDLIAWSRNITVNGHVKGDVLGWGQLVTVNGIVDGNVRAFCQTLSITGTVGKNAMAWSGDVNLDHKGKIGGSATIGAGDGELNGSIGGDVLAFIGGLEIDGPIGGNVRVRARHLSIDSEAVIVGTTKYEGNKMAEVAPGAKLASPIEFTHYKRGPDRASPRYYWHQALHWGAGFVFGLVLLLLAPGLFLRCRECLQKSWPDIRSRCLVSSCDSRGCNSCLHHDGRNSGRYRRPVSVCYRHILSAGVRGNLARREDPGRGRWVWPHARTTRAGPSHHPSTAPDSLLRRACGGYRRRLGSGRTCSDALPIYAAATCAYSSHSRSLNHADPLADAADDFGRSLQIDALVSGCHDRAQPRFAFGDGRETDRHRQHALRE